MNLVADESVDRQIVEGLRRQGYNVLYIEEMSPSISDKDVLSLNVFFMHKHFNLM